MDKNRISRPMRPDELAPHSEVTGTSRGGKCGGRAGKQRVLTWGDPARATGRGVSRSHSTAQRAGNNSEDSMSGRAKPNRNTPTLWRTLHPMKPNGEGAMSAATVGSMGAFRSKP